MDSVTFRNTRNHTTMQVSLEAMPGWARIIVLANPVTFCIEVARGYRGPYLALVPLQVALWIAMDVALFAKMTRA